MKSTAWALALCSAVAMAEPAGRSSTHVLLGGAHGQFHARSGELTGPPGTTPPGVTASMPDASTVMLQFRHRLEDGWWIQGLIGYPTRVDIVAGGTAEALGRVASARAWFPAVSAAYRWETSAGWNPFVAVGMHRSWFTSTKVEGVYSAAVSGTQSRAKLRPSFGPVLQLGVDLKVGERWVFDVSYLKYRIRSDATITTETPGAGEITRTIQLSTNPDILAVSMGYSF